MGLSSKNNDLSHLKTQEDVLQKQFLEELKERLYPEDRIASGTERSIEQIAKKIAEKEISKHVIKQQEQNTVKSMPQASCNEIVPQHSLAIKISSIMAQLSDIVKHKKSGVLEISLDLSSTPQMLIFEFQQGLPACIIQTIKGCGYHDFLYQRRLMSERHYTQLSQSFSDTTYDVLKYAQEHSILKGFESVYTLRDYLEHIYVFTFSHQNARVSFKDPHLSNSLYMPRIRLLSSPESLFLEAIKRSLKRDWFFNNNGILSAHTHIIINDKGKDPILVNALAQEEQTLLKLCQTANTIEDLMFSSYISEEKTCQMIYGMYCLDYINLQLPKHSFEEDNKDLEIEKTRILRQFQLIDSKDYHLFLGIDESSTEYEIEKSIERNKKQFARGKFNPHTEQELAIELKSIRAMIEHVALLMRQSLL